MNDDTAIYALPPLMKMEDSEELHAFLLDAWDRDIEIDCSAVARLNGLTAQLLVMAHNSWQLAGRTVTFSNPSDGFSSSITLLGLSHLLTSEQVTG